MLRALLFDFDGTIADTERDGHRVAYNAAFAELGLPWTWDVPEYGRLLAIAGGKERMRAYVERAQPAYDGPGLGALVQRAHDCKQRHFAGIAPQIPLRPGVRRLVLEAREAGLTLAIATTAAPNGVETLLAAHPDVRAAFALVAAGDVVPKKKPAPDIFTYALAELGLSPDACVALEDSANGLRAALAARLATIVTVSTYTTEEDFAGAHAVLDTLGEPQHPARTLAGRGPASGVVDVAYLQALVSK